MQRQRTFAIVDVMGFVNGVAFGWALLYGFLIALYLWERQRRRMDVPSLLLWRNVPDAPIRGRRFRPDPLFIIQCALLALLILGLAGPYFEDGSLRAPARRVAFLVDTSASMQTREGSRTRFELAREALVRRLRSLRAHDEAMLMTFGQQPRVIRTFNHDHLETARRVASLEPEDTPTNVSLALAVARSVARGGNIPATIELYTDLRAGDLPPDWREDVRLVAVGRTDRNVAITSFQIFQGRFQGANEAAGRITVRNFGTQEAHALLTVAIGDEVLSRHGFSLAAHATQSFGVGPFPSAGIARAAIEIAGGEAGDALPADNVALAWVRPSRMLHILVVTESAELISDLRTIMQADKFCHFTFLSPAEYRAGSEHVADAVLFHRFAPPESPRRPALFVAPPAENGLVKVRGTLQQAEIFDWDASHPVLRGLHPIPPYPIATALAFEPAAWTDVLLRSRAGADEVALGLAGSRGGKRMVFVGIDFAEERLLAADNLYALLFFLNSLDWLVPLTETETVLATGSTHVLAGLPSLPVEVTDPTGTVTSYSPAGRIVIDLPRVGVYSVHAGDSEQRLIANLFDARESDIGREPAAAPEDIPVRASANFAATLSPLSLWLLGLSLAGFIAEWMLAARA